MKAGETVTGKAFRTEDDSLHRLRVLRVAATEPLAGALRNNADLCWAYPGS